MTWKYLRFANFVVGVVGIILRVGSCGITLIPVQDGLNPNSIGIDVGGLLGRTLAVLRVAFARCRTPRSRLPEPSSQLLVLYKS